ncbi:MAG: energy-coupling factor transporter transmembrane component T [Clostridia bacterium]|nr:energy-coupling factor transporter transmembrane component T [Clostridia bacterium]
MDLAYLDHLAVQGESPLHKASAPAKLAFLALCLAGVIMARSVLAAGLEIAVLLAVIWWARLPLGRLFHYTLYPVFFSSVFALAGVEGFWPSGVMVILKAFGAALAVILVICSTSYVEVFAFLGRFLPTIVVDGLLVTYRSFFQLLSKMGNLFRTIRLRGGYSPLALFRNIRNYGAALGLIFIHSWEMAERMYKIMALRGYQGGIPSGNKAKFSPYDLLPLGLGTAILVMVVSI